MKAQKLIKKIGTIDGNDWFYMDIIFPLLKGETQEKLLTKWHYDA